MLVALLVTALLLPPVGDLLGGSGLALARRAGARRARRRALRPRRARRARSRPCSPPPRSSSCCSSSSSRPSPTSWRSATARRPSPARPARDVPIVHVVLDELPVTTLTDASGRIDAALFPNLAALAADGTWYRRATTVDDLTTEAVPSQLTGMQPRAGQPAHGAPAPAQPVLAVRRQPRADRRRADHRPVPGAALRRASARPPATACGRSSPIWRSSSSTCSCPEDLRRDLPAIDRVWEGFEQGPTDPGGLHGGVGPQARRAGAARRRRRGRRLRPRRRGARPAPPPPAARLRPLDAPPRLVAPPARRARVPDAAGAPPSGSASEGWIGPQWQVDQNFGRHVLQAQYADRLVGELMDALRADGLYDDAVIVVAADHGAVVPDGPAAPPGEHGQRGRHRRRAADRQAARAARGPRGRPLGAHDRRAADDRQGRRRADPVAHRRHARRRAAASIPAR